MVGKNLSHYKILEELGRRGMGITIGIVLGFVAFHYKDKVQDFPRPSIFFRAMCRITAFDTWIRMDPRIPVQV